MEFEELKIEIPIEEDEEDDNDELQLPPKKYENKAGSFVTGFDVNSEEALARRARRQKRFGVVEEEKKENDDQDSTEKVEDTCNTLPKDIPKIPQGDARLDALLVYGIQDLNTKDVFDYFQDYGPGSIEWIDDYSCNVVWDDEHSAARALDCMGKNIETAETETSDTNKLVWKAGPPCQKAGWRLLMRLSTKKDKKQVGAAKRSMYYLVHGYGNNSGKHGVKGLVSKSRKRKLMQEQERARHKSSGEPDVAFIDKIDTEEEKMEIDDEPPLKVVVKNEPRTTEDAFEDDLPQRLRLRMHADESEKEKGKIKDRLQERLQPDIENNIKTSSGDLRERLKSRRKHGFDFIDRPSLSIEIREEQT